MKSAEIIIAAGQVAQAIATVGLPAVQKIVEQFSSDKEPSLAELESVGSTMVKPENFFDDAEEDGPTD